MLFKDYVPVLNKFHSVDSQLTGLHRTIGGTSEEFAEEKAFFISAIR